MLTNHHSTKRQIGVFEAGLPSITKKDIISIDEKIIDEACCWSIHWIIICFAQKSKKNNLKKYNYTIRSRINCCFIAALFWLIDRLSSWKMLLYISTHELERSSRSTAVKYDISPHILSISTRSNVSFLFQKWVSSHLNLTI